MIKSVVIDWGDNGDDGYQGGHQVYIEFKERLPYLIFFQEGRDGTEEKARDVWKSAATLLSVPSIDKNKKSA